jgi:hypothetical protein
MMRPEDTGSLWKCAEPSWTRPGKGWEPMLRCVRTPLGRAGDRLEAYAKTADPDSPK